MVVEVVDRGREVLFLWVKVSFGLDTVLDFLYLLLLFTDHLLVDSASWFVHQSLGD